MLILSAIFFFLYQLNFFAKGIVDSVVEAEYLFKRIWDNNNSQAREKLNVSWRKSGKFKISYLNGNVLFQLWITFVLTISLRIFAEMIYQSSKFLKNFCECLLWVVLLPTTTRRRRPVHQNKQQNDTKRSSSFRMDYIFQQKISKKSLR